MESSRMEMNLVGFDFSTDQTEDQFSDSRTLMPRSVGNSTLDTLVAQIEDTQSRLNVTLRRLAVIEDEKQELLAKNKKMSEFFASYTDQLEVWKEKEVLWKAKQENLESEIQSLQTAQFNLNNLRQEADRYRRYHDKIKTQVKPYIHQLKAYAQSLQQELAAVNLQIDRKDTQLRELSLKLQGANELAERQVEESRASLNQLTQAFEDQRGSLLDELQMLKDWNIVLEKKAHKLDTVLEKQDELENTVLFLRRQKDEDTVRYTSEMSQLRESHAQTQQQLIEAQLVMEDLRSELELTKKESLARLAHKTQLDEQLSSLRYQWTNKAQENERLAQSIKSLEKINQDLSLKLSQLRKGHV